MVFLREHNRIAIELHTLNHHWSNEEVYQETRRIIIAIVQHITYNHFLPTVVDERTMRKYNLFSQKKGYDNTYDPYVDASITNGFGCAPWRYGHSQVMEELNLLRDDFFYTC